MASLPFVFPSALICQPRTPPPSTVGHSHKHTHTHTVNFTLATNSHYKPLRCSRLGCAALWPVTVTALYPLPHQGGYSGIALPVTLLCVLTGFMLRRDSLHGSPFLSASSFSSNFSFRVVGLAFRRLGVFISYNHPISVRIALKTETFI